MIIWRSGVIFEGSDWLRANSLSWSIPGSTWIMFAVRITVDCSTPHLATDA